jgi:hypothetical protein
MTAVGAARLFLHPVGDPAFRDAVHRSFSGLPIDAVTDPAILAAVEASLLPTYPLAKVWRRSGEQVPAWDAFRDGSILDDELLRRARAGDREAGALLYDRNMRLAYSAAAQVLGPAPAAAAAVVSAFGAILLDHDAGLPVRLRLARTSRDLAVAAIEGSGGSGIVRANMVIDLIERHGLTVTQVAAVLRLHVSEVRCLVARCP